MKVSTIMTTDPVTISVESSPDDALQLMDDQDVRHLPVMEGARLIGVLSDRDLLGALGWVPARTADARQQRHKEGVPRTVRELMHANVVTCNPNDRLVDACSELVLQRIGCVPVVVDGRLAGIVSEMDVLLAYYRACKLGNLSGDANPAVSQLMTTFASTVEPETTFEDAAAICHELKARHLPVVDDGILVGIVSDRDLRGAAGSDQPGDTPVERIMSSQVITLSPDDQAARAAHLMVENRFSAVPIVVDGRLEGIVTLTDLLDHCLGLLDEFAGSRRG
jgi:CBS domain-containing protein